MITFAVMKRIVVLITSLLFGWSFGCSQALDSLTSYSQLRSCDLLFCINREGNAITDVTRGADGMKIDHVGIYHKGRVIEAIPEKGVCLTPIDSFMERNRHLIIIGRVNVPFSKRKTLRKANALMGLPYDSLYMPDLKAVYCSELVQQCFVDKRGQLLFSPIGMTFRDSSGEIAPYWTSFYGQLQMAVPEGLPGSNPGELSRRKAVKLLYRTF